MKWDDISLKTFNELSKIEGKDSLEKSAKVLDILFPDKAPTEDLPFYEFDKLLKEIDFLNNDMPQKILADKYTINGHVYILKGNVYEATASQIMDFRSAIRQEQYDYASALACFLVPENHSYNDGYDMNTVLEDISCLPITDATAICSFFIKSFSLSTTILLEFFQKTLKRLKLKKNKEMKKDLNELQEIVNNLNSIYFQ